MKKYTNKEEYVAFYWDGSNAKELRQWLGELGVDEDNSIYLFDITGDDSRYVLDHDGFSRDVLYKSSPEWIVLSYSAIIRVCVYDVKNFNKFFLEVAE